MKARVFAYGRVNVVDQKTGNQVREIEATGFSIDPRHIVTETVSDFVAVMEHKGFTKLVDRLKSVTCWSSLSWIV